MLPKERSYHSRSSSGRTSDGDDRSNLQQPRISGIEGSGRLTRAERDVEGSHDFRWKGKRAKQPPRTAYLSAVRTREPYLEDFEIRCDGTIDPTRIRTDGGVRIKDPVSQFSPSSDPDYPILIIDPKLHCPSSLGPFDARYGIVGRTSSRSK